MSHEARIDLAPGEPAIVIFISQMWELCKVLHLLGSRSRTYAQEVLVQGSVFTTSQEGGFGRWHGGTLTSGGP